MPRMWQSKRNSEFNRTQILKERVEKLNTKTITITGCKQCEHFDFDPQDLPIWGKYACQFDESIVIEMRVLDDDETIPDWCPLP